MGDPAYGAHDSDPYLGYWEIILVSLGLAYCFSRLDWKKTILLLAAFLGVGSFLFTGATQGGRLLGCLVPLYVISGLGLNALLSGLRLEFNHRGFFFFVWVFIIAYFAWAALGVLSRVYP
jgi:hypothetical protein